MDKRMTVLVYNKILSSILDGDIHPGQTINLDKLQEATRMSRTPIRAALIALESEGLVSRNGRSYSVVFLNKKEINDLYLVRRILEAEAAAQVAGTVSVKLKQELKDALKKVNVLIRNDEIDPINIADLSGQFHSIINRASGNEILFKYTDQIRKMLRIVRVSIYTTSERCEDDLEEHTRIFNAIKNGEVQKAWREMYSHETQVLSYVNKNVLPKLL